MLLVIGPKLNGPPGLKGVDVIRYMLLVKDYEEG